APRPPPCRTHMTERTLSIIKPDATRRNLTGKINAVFEGAGLRIVAQKRMMLSQAQAEAFYGVHRERGFFRDLVPFMTSGPVVVQAPPAPPSGIEGRYRGTARLVQSNNRFCPRSGPRVYELQNGQIELSYQGPGRTRVPLTAPIQPDGTFDVSDGQGRLQG